MNNVIPYSRFENSFIERTYNTVVSDISVAFSELVANAWDAGAKTINIKIPYERGEDIILEDDGSGMTDDEFRNRWMIIAYNRVEHQGNYVQYEDLTTKRLAYGRNGIGRHALICFDDEYIVETWKKGVCNRYHISVDGGQSAFSIVNHNQYHKEGHGTKLIVKANKKLPQTKEVIQTLGYRFLFDPEFTIRVNNKEVEYKQLISPVKTDIVSTKYGDIGIEIYNIPDGEKTTALNGVAFWAGKRLIGNPSWNIDDYRVEDARRRFALKHLIIIKVDFLIDDVRYDWSGFQKTNKVKECNKIIKQYISKYRIDYYKGKTSEVRSDVIRKNLEDIRALSASARDELRDFFDIYLAQKPEIDATELNVIIQALINVLNSRNGIPLLSKLSKMSNSEIESLDSILDEWSVFDIKCVLDEIDSRLKIIDAIQKLSSDNSTDELHVLHPLISQARWLFGVEFDNNYYTFNRRLSTVMQELLQYTRKDKTTINWLKRPDLVIAADYSIAATCMEDFDDNNIAKITKILIIELKKGKFTIGRNEMNQAEEYVDSLYKGNKLNAKPKIKAFVVGDSIDSSISTSKKQEDYGEVIAYTYSQLVRTAEKRLFDLKEKLNSHYEELSDDDYIKSILREPRQISMIDK